MSDDDETIGEVLDEIPNPGDVTFRGPWRIEMIGHYEFPDPPPLGVEEEPK